MRFFNLLKGNNSGKVIYSIIFLFPSMNCKVYDISYAQLKELKDTCQKVLDNHDLASELLPVTRGCFFGSYSYDDSYFYDLEYTVKSLNELLDESDESDEFYYHAWW